MMKAWNVGDSIYAARSAEEALQTAIAMTGDTAEYLTDGEPVTECDLNELVYEDGDKTKSYTVRSIVETVTKPCEIASDYS